MEHDFTPDGASPWPEKVDKVGAYGAPVATSDTAQDALPPSAVTMASSREGGPRRELVLGALVVLLTGAGTLALLVARETPPAAVAAANPVRRAPAPVPVADAAWTNASPRWIANPAAWLGRNKGVAFEVSSAEPISVWMRTVRPALVVRCMGKRAEVFVFTDSAATIEANTDDHTVSYAFDEHAPTSLRWPDGAEHNALFAPDGGELARRLMASETFTFSFTPHNAATVTARFNTAGLQPLLAPALKHCW